MCFSVSPDGMVVATGSEDGTIILWDAERRRIICEWVAHRDVTHSVGFSPDGARLVSTSTSGVDQYVCIWNVPSGTLSGAFFLGIRDEVKRSPVWSPDGAMLVVSEYAHGFIESQPDRSAQGLAIWNTDTFTQTCILRDSHYFPLKSVFFPREQWFKSGADCGLWSPSTFDPTTRKYIAASTSSVPSWSIGVWDMVTGECVVSLRTSDVLGATSSGLHFIAALSLDDM